MALDTGITTVELNIGGMDCPSCAGHIEEALRRYPGVREVQVLVAAGRARVEYDPRQVPVESLRQAITTAGFSLLEGPPPLAPGVDIGTLTTRLVAAVGAAVLVLAAGEGTGLLDRTLGALPAWLMAAVTLAAGGKMLLGVLGDLLRGQITSRTLMVIGAVASAAVSEWISALVIVLFMRFAEWVESQTALQSRQALGELVSLRPQSARVLRLGIEVETPVGQVRPGDLVVVRPGERIPVDGEIVEGAAAVDQAAVTGESLPADLGPGDPVFAATLASGGYLKIRATRVGEETTFSRIVRLVEEAEQHRAPVQRFADRFARYYLPLVLVIAAAVYLLTGNVISAVSVLVVACACAIALATPVVVLASVGAAARAGILVKGGAALEQLARVDTLVIDKTGTLTEGRPQVTDFTLLSPVDDERAVWNAVATLEGCSEHPIARALVQAAREHGATVWEPRRFRALPGLGVEGDLGDDRWVVGNRRLMESRGASVPADLEARAEALEADGKTVLYAAREKRVVALFAVADRLRPEARAALDDLRDLGIARIVMLTGDNERCAAAVARHLGVEHVAELLPEHKIEIVRGLQADGAAVMMVGDGVNDAPALAQAQVGVAMGATGTDVAAEAAHVVLLRDDWSLVPEALRAGRRATTTIRQNLAFTGAYNVLGIALAAAGMLPPIWAALAHNLPDVVVMLNSGRLIRKPGWRKPASPASPPAAHAHVHDHGSCCHEHCH